MLGHRGKEFGHMCRTEGLARGEISLVIIGPVEARVIVKGGETGAGLKREKGGETKPPPYPLPIA